MQLLNLKTARVSTGRNVESFQRRNNWKRPISINGASRQAWSPRYNYGKPYKQLHIRRRLSVVKLKL